MRYFVGFVFVLALMASPLSVSAQDAEEAATAEPGAKEPALQLKLDDAGVGVVPPPPRTPDGYTLQEMELRVTRARIGLGVSTVPIVIGGTIALGGALSSDCFMRCFLEPNCPPPPPKCDVLPVTGAVLAIGGVVGMITSGIVLGVRKRKMHALQEAHYGRPHRVQWDLAQSRLVF